MANTKDLTEAATDDLLRKFHITICMNFLLDEHQMKLKQPKESACSADNLLACGLQFQDVEWFTRAAITMAVIKVSLLSALPTMLLYVQRIHNIGSSKSLFSVCKLSCFAQEYSTKNEAISTTLFDKITRHAERLMVLAPQNPASFELACLVSLLDEKRQDLSKAAG